PLSHCSFLMGSMMPLPHVSSERQSPEQPSPDVMLPSSQTSATSLFLSPQRGTWQSGQHRSAASSWSMPASHCSPCFGSLIPSPHLGSLQFVRHCESAAFEFIAPRSHCSLIVSMMPLPQTSSERQSDEQPSPLTVLPSSQTSPNNTSVTPLPHTSTER